MFFLLFTRNKNLCDSGWLLGCLVGNLRILLFFHIRDWSFCWIVAIRNCRRLLGISVKCWIHCVVGGETWGFCERVFGVSGAAWISVD